MPSPRLAIAAAAVLITALPAYYALHRTSPGAVARAPVQLPACPRERQLADGRCACLGETRWSDSACVPRPPMIRPHVSAVVLGPDLHSDNCVFFVRDRIRSLPYGLGTWKGKLAIINAQVPRVGSAAMIEIPTGLYKDVGHVAIVEKVTDNTITILEANYYTGRVSRRSATGADLDEAARMLGIAGYFRP